MARQRALSPEEFRRRLRDNDWSGIGEPRRVSVTRVEFTVPGIPRPKARPRVTCYGTYTPKRTKQYQNLVRAWFRATVGEHRGWTPWEGPVSLGVTAYGAHHAADADNILKAVSDALNKLAYVDDRQIAETHAEKRPAAKGHERAVVVVARRLKGGT